MDINIHPKKFDRNRRDTSDPSKLNATGSSICAPSVLKNMHSVLFILRMRLFVEHHSVILLNNVTQESTVMWRSGEIFYESHGEIMNMQRIPAEYKLFIEEVLPKYKYYQLQIEFTWLECVAEFTKLVSKFSKFLDNYYTDTLVKYFEIRKEKLIEKGEEIINNLEENLKCIENYYISIHTRLKPMYGHPSMNKMLSVIDSYMDQAEEFSTKTLLDLLDPNKEGIKTHCINTESIFLDMERILSCIKGSTSMLCMKRKLEKQLIIKTDKMQKRLSIKDDSAMSIRRASSVMELNIKKKLREYKEKAEIPPDIKISYESILQSSTNVESPQLLDIEELVRGNYSEFESYEAKIENFRERCSDIHHKYKTMWKQDVDRILNLYKVKYDTPTYE
ncbi:hypothetical protein HHI36_017555 [Cryptolaemus montrouzieri]|uniref:Uncharacterized protein n=1 Tax=Cryptolaemus montrouzieri TaxID=559131 RepID=A0ABD2NN13_9CUCU